MLFPATICLAFRVIRLHFGLQRLESITFGIGGWVILVLDVGLVLCMKGFLDLFIGLIEPVFMNFGLCPKNLLSSLSDGFLERGPFSSAIYRSEAILKLFVKLLLELEKVSRIFQPGHIVRNPNSLGLISVGRWYVQRQYGPD